MNEPLEMLQFPESIRSVYDLISEKYGEVCFTGSRAIGGWDCDSDFDFVVFSEDSYIPQEIFEKLSCGFGGNCSVGTEFTSVRINKVNLIIEHQSREDFERWQVATDYCKEHQLRTKKERVDAFEMLGVGQIASRHANEIPF